MHQIRACAAPSSLAVKKALNKLVLNLTKLQFVADAL